MYPIRSTYQRILCTQFRLVLFIPVFLLVFLLTLPTAAQDMHSIEVLNYINQARNQAGIHSLIMNAQLIAAAQRHSDDMANGDFLDHVGSDGSEFWDRMSAAGYAMTSGAENLLYRWDVNAYGVFEQWRNSGPHNANMMSADYVEAGLAYAKSTSGKYYYTLVLGARVGVEPQVATSIPLPTNTVIPATPIPATSIPTWTSVPPTAAPPTVAPTATLAPPTTIPPTLGPTVTPITGIPDTPNGEIYLIYSWNGLTLLNLSGHNLDLSQLAFMNINMPASQWASAELVQTLKNFPSPDCLQIWTTDTTTQPVVPDSCRYRHVSIVEREEAFWRNVDSFVVLNGTELIALCDVMTGLCEVDLQEENSITQVTTTPAPPTIPPTATYTPAPPDLRLYYSEDDLALVNVSGKSLDLTGLTFQSTSGTLSVDRWNTEYLSHSLNDFPSNDCLQVWGFGSDSLRSKPSECDTRHAWIVVGDGELFWRDVDYFTVNRNGIELGLCATGQGVCEIYFSGQSGGQTGSQSSVGNTPIIIVPTATQVPTVNSSADVRLIYSQDMVTLINTSGRNLDLSQLAFESDNGVMLASYWDNGNMSRPLGAYPSGDCLQVWGAGEESQPKPAECRYRHAWSAVSLDKQFWRNVTSFRVRRGAEVLATCNTAATVCEFNMP